MFSVQFPVKENKASDIFPWATFFKPAALNSTEGFVCF